MQHWFGRLSSRFWSQEKGPYALLFFLAFTLFVLSPLLSARIVAPVILEIAFSLILVSGAFVVSTRTSVRCLAIAVAALSVASRLMGISPTEKTLVIADTLVTTGMISGFAFLMIRNFLAASVGSAHRIAAAVTVYLLLGLIWAELYRLVELMSPGAFRIPENESLTVATFVYFSFVTLATLGYGDITPANIIARDLAILEAIMGQLYLVILISRLVSEHTANQGTREQGKQTPFR